MALGSSAPEILLSVLETSLTLGACPGELGASTIVGSAAFNLLVISGLSIYAVSEENDDDDDRDETVNKGIKKINDMGVFSVTAVTSILCYLWMFYCLYDQYIQWHEAWITFLLFFVFIGLAYAADRAKAASDKKKAIEDGEDPSKSGVVHVDFSAIELYRELVKDKQGEKVTNEAEAKKRESMKMYLKQNMKTDQID